MKKQQTTIKYTPEDMRLARLLFDLVKDENPAWYVKPNWDKWADHIRLIREKDNRTTEQIEFVIRWVHNDPFWKQNILSPEKLRIQFNSLIVKIGGAMKQIQDKRPKMKL